MYINLGFINRSIDSAHRHNFKLDRLFEIQGVGIIPQRIFVLCNNKNSDTIWCYADYNFADVCTDWQGVYVVNMSCALVDGKRVFGTINGECQRCIFAINLFGILSFNFIFYSKSGNAWFWTIFCFYFVVVQARCNHESRSKQTCDDSQKLYFHLQMSLLLQVAKVGRFFSI